MPHRVRFNQSIFQTIVGGQSVIDTLNLNIQTLEEASEAIKSYGYDYELKEDNEKLWYFFRRALVLFHERLGFDLKKIPDEIADPKKLEDLRKLMLWASQKSFNSQSDRYKSYWACAILRSMHVYVHCENDLFSFFSEEIQKQILSPFEQSIFRGGKTNEVYLGNPENGIRIQGFEVKPLKTSTSTVLKLLAKPELIAMSVFDKLGVRFITKNISDAFYVIQYLATNSLISYPHVIPDQSSNNLYPVDLFLKAHETVDEKILQSPSQWNNYLSGFLKENEDSAKFLRKENIYSSDSYRFIKFIARRLIKISENEKLKFSFFLSF